MGRRLAAGEQVLRGGDELAGGEAVEGGDFAGEGTEGGSLDFLLVLAGLKLGIVLAQVIALGTKLVKALCFKQHTRVRTGQASDCDEADDSCADKGVHEVDRNGELAERAV